MRNKSLVGIGVVVAVALAGVSVGSAGAKRGHQRPLRIQSSTFTQSGQQITWRVQLATPFSPAALAHEGRTLCLLRERVGNGSVAGSLCIYGPKPGQRTPRLFYSRIAASGLGPGHRITATIGRSNARTLTATFLPGDIGTATCRSAGR